MAEIKKCEVCGKRSEKKCGKCHNVFYCGKEHQVLGWKSHKKVCRCFKICCNEELGRYVVATKPIKEGDVILEEPPLILSPKRNELVCMGCSTTLDRMTVNYCNKCGWPLCSEQCPDKANHIPECYYTIKRGKKISLTESERTDSSSIMTLRCLYQKKFCPELWQKINYLQSSYKGSEKSTLLETLMFKTVSDIYNIFRLNDEFTEDEIEQVCGILVINRFGLSASSPFDSAIYQTSSMFEHCCTANAYRDGSPKGKLRIVAGMEIKEGDHLSISYVDPIWITPRRQKHLQQIYLFTCKCERCTDVTEFGTNFSALKCGNKNCEGIVLPESFLVAGLEWTCNKCQFKMTADSVAALLGPVECKLIEIRGNNSDANDYRTFLKQYEQLLPENHGLMVDAKLDLTKINQEDLHDVSDAQLRIQIDLCREMLNILQAVVPGQKDLKSCVLVGLLYQLLQMYCRSRMRPEDSGSILMELKFVLSELLKHFQYGTGETYQFSQNYLMVKRCLAALNTNTSNLNMYFH